MRFETVEINGRTLYRCPFDHGVVGISRVPVEALFPSEADVEGHLDRFHSGRRYS